MPSDAGTARAPRALRDRPFGKVAILVAVLLAAILVSRSCGATETELSQSEAIEIARDEIDYEPDRVQIRFLKRGFQQRENWAVSLSTLDAAGNYVRITVVVVDAKTGRVVEIRRQR